MFYVLLTTKKPLVSYHCNSLGNEAIGNGVRYIPFSYFSFMDSLPPFLWSCVSKLHMPCKLCTQISLKNKILFGCDVIKIDHLSLLQ